MEVTLVKTTNHRITFPVASRAQLLLLTFLICGLANTCLPVNSSFANEIETVRVYPAEVNLTHASDRQPLVVQAVRVSGVTEDHTHQATYQLAASEVAHVEGNVIHPVGNGETVLTVSCLGQQIKVPVRVSNAKQVHPVSFKNDVMPIFMRAGCNQGSCHGAARGKDGFRLSLFGFDPDGDFHRLTREITGRRINLAYPEESLLLEKATGAVPHTGGSPLKRDTEHYQTLLRWLRTGAAADSKEPPHVVRLELDPPEAVLSGPESTQQFVVRATYSDGTDRDVTALVFFASNNDSSAKVSPQGLVTAGQRGEAFITARFDTHTVGSHLIVLPEAVDFQWRHPPQLNYIDQHIDDKLKKLRIHPSELCSDEVFVRRAYLDICGLLPTTEQRNQFVASQDPAKREKLVDQLLERKEFVELWVMKWSELLQIRSSQLVSYKSMLLYHNWLQSQIASNVPIDEMVRNLLAAKGGTFANPETNYYMQEPNQLKIAENVAQVFMGMRIQCAQCHNHPFDRWTMDDYYGFAAFFSQIGRKRAEDPREIVIFNRFSGEVRHPVGGRPVPPKFLGDVVPDVKGKDRRQVLGDWMASDDNPYFARNLANLVWAHFLGRGIIEPVDDVRISNPAANPQLLDALATRFVEYRYDFKKLVRDICTSRTYQLSTQSNESNQSDERNFSHAPLRRLRAEIMLDAISQVTNTQDKFRALPLGARAVQVADGNTTNYFLSTFGRASRRTVCSCEVKMEPNLSQALHLMNGSTVQAKIQRGRLVQQWSEQGKSPEDMIQEIYLRCLSRHATPDELKQILEIVDGHPAPQQAIQDVFWAVLNSREFLFNH